MGMLIHHTWLNQQKQDDAPVEEAKVEEEIPFTDPEEPVEEPVKKTVKKTATPTRRRKSSGK